MCTELNATEICYPGTTLRLVYRPIRPRIEYIPEVGILPRFEEEEGLGNVEDALSSEPELSNFARICPFVAESHTHQTVAITMGETSVVECDQSRRL